MAVQYCDRILRFGETTLETFDRLRRKRNFGHEDDRAASALQRSPNCLQINFSLAAAGHCVQQNWSRVFRRIERLGYFLQRQDLLRIQFKIRGCDELLVAVRVAHNCFFVHIRQTAFDQRAQRLIIERCLAQKVGCAQRFFQSRDRLQKFRLARSASTQLFDFLIVNLAHGADEQLLFPPDFGAPDYLRQQTAHYRFDWAAVVGADPFCELEQFFAQDGRLADHRFDRPETFRLTVAENCHDGCECRPLTNGDGSGRLVGLEHRPDPMLVKAVVWRESRFDPNKNGSAGERGLMQVSEKAAREWARENKIDNFHIEKLFDPKTNLEAGTWYLRRAFEHWETQSDPLPFALAEYNAGASRAQRWSGGDGGAAIPPRTFLKRIDFPGTRKYVDSISPRYAFYQQHGRM